MLIDDVAGIIADFNFRLVEDAVDWHRQHAESRRPAVGKLREYCQAHRPATSRSQADREHEAYLRDIQLHPEKYIPVNFFLNAAVQVGEQRKREKFGNEEAKRRISVLVEAQRVEWLVEVRKHQAADRKTVGAGA